MCQEMNSHLMILRKKYLRTCRELMKNKLNCLLGMHKWNYYGISGGFNDFRVCEHCKITQRNEPVKNKMKWVKVKP